MAFPNRKIEGIVAATFTPLTDEGDLKLNCIPKYVDFLMAQGVKGVFVNGSTGEGVNFSVAERKRVAEEWVVCGKGRFDLVIIQVGGSNLIESQELARHAESIGADAIAALPAIYFKPNSISELVTYMKSISESAPKTPLYYYHIPLMSGVSFKMESFFEAAENQIPTFSGVKFTSTDLFDFCRCVQFNNEKYQVFFGGDEILLGALALGGKAAVGSTYNFCGRIVNNIIEAIKNGKMDTAMEQQFKIQAIIKLHIKYGGNLASLKALMNLLGFDVGPPRKPLLPLTDEQMRQLKGELKGIGFNSQSL